MNQTAPVCPHCHGTGHAAPPAQPESPVAYSVHLMHPWRGRWVPYRKAAKGAIALVRTVSKP